MKRIAITLLLCVFATVGQAATVAFTDFTNDQYATSGSGIASNFTQGFQFTSGATGDLSAIRISITAFPSSNTGFNLTLYSDNAGTLGTVLWVGGGGAPEANGGTSAPITEIDVTTPTFTLLTAQKYWLVATGPSGSNLNWRQTVPGVVLPHYSQSNSNPATYDSGTAGGFEVQVVPEPVSGLLLAGGALLLARRRRQRAGR